MYGTIKYMRPRGAKEQSKTLVVMILQSIIGHHDSCPLDAVDNKKKVDIPRGFEQI